jgi:hypothetical protein
VAAFRRARDVISLVGLEPGQVGWMFSVQHADAVPAALQGCANGASDVTRNIFPGDAYVDWVGVAGFSSCSTEAPSALFDPMVSVLRSLSSRPVSIDDVGASSCAPATPADKGAWLAGYLRYVESADVKMSVWRNLGEWAVFSPALLAPASRGDCTYSAGALTTYNVYCAYPEGLAGSHFTGGDDGNPRIVGDAQFRGTWRRAQAKRARSRS